MNPVEPTASEIRTRAQPTCWLCANVGSPLHHGLEDRLFGAPGRWTLKQCRNPACQLVWLDPMPLEEDLPRAYRTYYTHTAESDSGGPSPGRRLYAALRDGYLARRYGYPAVARTGLWPLIYLHPGWRAEADYSVMHQRVPQTPMRLLDVGCGDGAALVQLRDRGWQDVHGVDLDPAAVEAARRRGLDVRPGTLASQGYPDASFEVITMTHVIEHVADPVALLRECRRILKPGGHLVVATPNVESWGHAMFQESWRGLEPPRHLHLFRPATLQETLTRSGRWTIHRLRTTVRGAGDILRASTAIRRRREAGSEPERRRWGRLWSHGFVYAEAALLKVRPRAGEEILLIASRSAN